VKDTELIPRGSTLPDIGVSPEVTPVAFYAAGARGQRTDPHQRRDRHRQVVSRDDVKPDAFAKEKETFRAELLNERRNRFFTAYMTKVEGADEDRVEARRAAPGHAAERDLIRTAI
jgi:hypothetical protein